MNERKLRMLQDRHLRDSARALVEADFEHLKADFAAKSLGDRAMDRVAEGAVDLYEEAIEMARDNKGALAALLAAVVVWFTRHPLLAILGIDSDPEDEEDDRRDEFSGEPER